ncbi:aminoglycoside phosphotransferase family protein [Microtetraspora sp. AC03309]|uniref:aminoglycoside phosphotransferase family protein n=1 Tax=Microtetraspora sp. AC03309 TaxID=2779376 RepID=UPI001E63A1B8|nr:aminoglycoside phosphotransferase family protein [Microtetraspora sp. AC03309]MCC5578141.1 aminoglycoside phosphotransferase family protein [Microtetraspora sp. AC03309]
MRPKPPFGEELRARLGPVTRVRRLTSSPRSRVWRAEIGGSTAVIKQVVGEADADLRFRREITALRLAARADPPLVPEILATDPGPRILVLEYLDGGDPPEDWRVRYAAALARLHASANSSDAGALPRWSPPGPGDLDAFLRLAGDLRVTVPPTARAELEDVLNRLGLLEGDSLLHGDPCPGNDLYTGDGVRFVDFEQAALGNGLAELAYLRIGFPTCWCVTATPGPVLHRAEAAYRTAWRAATGTEARGDLTDACVGWLLRGDALVQRAGRDGTDHLARVTRRDWRWGTATARQRLLHRLAVVRDAAAGRADLARVGDLAAAMRSRMLERWPALRPVPSRRP